MRRIKKIFSSIKWLTLSRFIILAFDFISKIFVIKILLPKDLGIFALLSLIVGGLQLLLKPAWQLALVNKRKDLASNEPAIVDVIWTINIIKGLVLTLLLVSTSKYIVILFDHCDYDLQKIICLFAILPFINGLRNPKQYIYMISYDFKRIGLYECFISIINILFLVVFAYSLKNVYAFIFASLISSIFAVVLSFILFPKNINLSFNFKESFKIMKFGLLVMVDNGMSHISRNLEGYIIGFILGTSSLGIYSFAKSISYSLFNELANIFSKIMFPLFSEIQKDKRKVINIFELTLVTFAVCFPLISLGIIMAIPFVIDFVGDKWHEAINIVPLCLISSMCCNVNQFMIESFLRGIGFPGKGIGYRIIKIIPLVVTFIYFGKIASFFSILISMIIGEYIIYLLLVRFITSKYNISLTKFFVYTLLLIVSQTLWFIIQGFLQEKVAALFLCPLVLIVFLFLVSNIAKRFNRILIDLK